MKNCPICIVSFLILLLFGTPIKQFLLQQKQQEFVNRQIRTLGRRISIDISTSWLKKHALLARDNPVDKMGVK